MRLGWSAGLAVGALGLLLVACSSGTSGDHPPVGGAAGDDNAGGAPPELAGFNPFPMLGKSCRAGIADDPESEYGPLGFFPCRSGEADCQEPDWAGSLSWNPTGAGDLLLYSLQVSLDPTGAVTRLMLSKQYPISPGSSDTPQEAVAYSLPDGAPLAALRNLGEDSNDSSAAGAKSSCALMPAAADEGLVLVAAASGRTALSWGYAPYETATSPFALQPFSADPTALLTGLFASGEVAGLTEDDGAIWRLDLPTMMVTRAQGDTQRLWLDGAIGDELLLRNLDRTKYITMAVDGATPVAVDGSWLRGDGERLAWLVTAASGVEVWGAARDGRAPSKSARKLATLEHATAITAVTLGDGALAVQYQTSQVGADSLARTVDLIDLADGSVRSRTRDDDTFLLLANTADTVWVGEAAIIRDDTRQFERVLRLLYR